MSAPVPFCGFFGFGDFLGTFLGGLGVWGLGLDNYIVQAGFALARKFGLVSKGSSKHDPTLETVEKSLARKEKTEQNNRSV